MLLLTLWETNEAEGVAMNEVANGSADRARTMRIT